VLSFAVAIVTQVSPEGGDVDRHIHLTVCWGDRVPRPDPCQSPTSMH